MKDKPTRSRYFSFTTCSPIKQSPELWRIWSTLKIEWFAKKYESDAWRFVFKTKESVRKTACQKMVTLLKGLDLVMERSFRHNEDKSKLNLLYKFGMQCEEVYKHYSYVDMQSSADFEEASLRNERIKYALSRRDGVKIIKDLFRELAPNHASARNVQYLLSYPSLELHRKVMMLEHFYGSCYDKAQKAVAVDSNNYPVVDDVTALLPLIFW